MKRIDLTRQEQEQALTTRLARYALEYPSLDQALGTLLESEQLTAAAYFAESLGLFWETHEYLAIGGRWLERIQQHPGASELPGGLQAHLALIAGNLARHRSEYGRAQEFYQFANQQLDPKPEDLQAGILTGLGEIAFRRGEYPAAEATYRQMLALSQEAQAVTYSADALNGLGRLAMVSADFDQAAALHNQGGRLVSHLGYRQGQAWHLNGLGELERARSNYGAAIEYFSAAEAIFGELHNLGCQMLVRQNLGFGLLAAGETDRAERCFRDAAQFWQRGPSQHGLSLCLIGIAGVLQARGTAPQAAACLGAADGLLRGAGIRLEITDQNDQDGITARVERAVGGRRFDELAQTGQKAGWAGLLASGVETTGRPALTGRELEVLRLVREGRADKEISAALAISPYTVNVHLRSIYRKLGVRSRTAAVRSVFSDKENT